jgi:hypothetical protein
MGWTNKDSGFDSWQRKDIFICLFSATSRPALRPTQPPVKWVLGSFARDMWQGLRRWVDNIKMDLRDIGWDGVDWIDMAQDRDQWRALVNTVLNLRVP